jgi:hypothetical protein
MDLYRFSPIESPTVLDDAIRYIADECTWLFFNEVGYVAPIRSLTIFAHYPDEYDHLARLVTDMGVLVNENKGPRVKLREPVTVHVGNIEVNGLRETVTQTIEYLRVRRPDPYRMQVGCAVYDVSDYWDFKSFYGLVSASPRTLDRGEYEVLEFFSPSSDVLGYAVSN